MLDVHFKGETTEEQVIQMRALCQRLEQSLYVKSAHVDDWGYYGNFSVHIVPTFHDRFTTARLKALVNRNLKETQSHLRDCFSPDPVLEYVDEWSGRRRVVTGYQRNYWVFDIDYQKYNASTNRFGF